MQHLVETKTGGSRVLSPFSQFGYQFWYCMSTLSFIPRLACTRATPPFQAIQIIQDPCDSVSSVWLSALSSTFPSTRSVKAHRHPCRTTPGHPHRAPPAPTEEVRREHILPSRDQERCGSAWISLVICLATIHAGLEDVNLPFYLQYNHL